MPKTVTEIFNEKVSLIYEYDKHSPLFARTANTEIENNNVEKAIEILKNGLELFPDYSVAHLLLGKALTLTGNYSQALKEIKTGSELINSKRTYNYYLKEIENIKKQRSLFETSRGRAFLSGEFEPDEEKEPELFDIQLNEKNDSREISTAFEDRLDSIAKEISHAKIKDRTGSEDIDNYASMDFSEENMIVSETLAKIYIAQGEYKEAVKVYRKLLDRNPDKKDYYTNKINEINSQLEL